jgi:hypothetical protein
MLLLGHEEDDVVRSTHFRWSIRHDGLAEIHRTYHLRTLCLQGLYMSFVPVNEFDGYTSFADECS